MLCQVQLRTACRGDRERMPGAFASRHPHQDTFIKEEGTWRFSERRLYVDWTETRTIRASNSGE